MRRVGLTVILDLPPQTDSVSVSLKRTFNMSFTVSFVSSPYNS